MALYYLDLPRNEVLVHAEAPGCYDPMPLRSRTPAAGASARRNFDDPHAPGLFYLQNARHRHAHAGLQPGTVKFLRIVESPRNATGRGGNGSDRGLSAGMNWHNFEDKRILGTVPVEDDGSAYFEVPATRSCSSRRSMRTA
jgi:hypothetical protein